MIGEFNLAYEPHKVRILTDACKTDLIKRLDDAAVKAPLTVKGSMGQEVINPLIAQAQTARMQLAELLARLNFTQEDDDDGDVAYTTAQPSTEELHDAIAARLPDELKSFDAWYYNSGDGPETGYTITSPF